jgi:RNA polymerase sigma-70 factor (ECF subfamily)
MSLRRRSFWLVFPGQTNAGHVLRAIFRNLASPPGVLVWMVAHAMSPVAARPVEPILWDGPCGTNTLVMPREDADFAMELYAGGDAAAFVRVYDAIAPRLYGYLLRQTRDRSRAEDLLQHTMLHIHRARDRFIAGAEVMPWAFAIARRLLVDDIRRNRRIVLSDDGEPDPGVSLAPMADDVAHAGELAVRIQVILARLPHSQRAAFELIKQEGLTVAEAAQVLGTTVAAVKLRAHRAYEALRASLGESDAGFEGGKS